MKIEKVYLNKRYEGMVVCLKCHRKKMINVTNYDPRAANILTEKNLTVKCPCGNIFCIKFELRKYERKNVQLRGEAFTTSLFVKLADIVVTSISLGGLGFDVKDCNTIKVGDRLQVTFNLNDQDQTTIYEEVIVRRIDGTSIGVEFCHAEQYNYELDFYISDNHGVR